MKCWILCFLPPGGFLYAAEQLLVSFIYSVLFIHSYIVLLFVFVIVCAAQRGWIPSLGLGLFRFVSNVLTLELWLYLKKKLKEAAAGLSACAALWLALPKTGERRKCTLLADCANTPLNEKEKHGSGVYVWYEWYVTRLRPHPHLTQAEMRTKANFIYVYLHSADAKNVSKATYKSLKPST